MSRSKGSCPEAGPGHPLVRIPVVVRRQPDDLLGLDASHAKIVRDNSRAWFQLAELRNQLDVEFRQKIERDDVRFREIECEDILLLDLNQILDPVFFNIGK